MDEAIDRTLKALMRRDAPMSIRRRVLAQLAERQPVGSGAPKAWLRRRRLAWSVAAVAFVLGSALVATLWWDRFTESPIRTTLESTPKRETPPPVAPDSTRMPTVGTAGSARAGVAGRRSLGRTGNAAASAWFAEDTEGSPLIDPLATPDPIAIFVLETEAMTTEGVDVAPIVLEPLHIEPIQGQR